MKQIDTKIRNILTVFLTVLALSFGLTAKAQAPDSKGTDFWLTFPGNYSASQLSFFISGDANTTGTVSIPGLGFTTNFSVTAGVVTTVTIPATAELNASNTVENKGIHIVSLKEVTIYGLSRLSASTDAYLALPTDILGTSYINLGYKNTNIVNSTQLGLVATENGTTVTITPTVTTGVRAAGVPFSITLNQGQTFLLRNTNSAPADLSGTIITSTKPIAVFGGMQCANIPPGYVACDYVVEQLPPTEAWGKNFISVPLKTRRNGDTFRFLASVNNTVVQVNGTTVATLNKGELYETILTTASQITANQPILVAQYSNSSSFDNVTSDPFMMLITPYEQYLGNYTFSTPASGFSGNYVNVVAPAAAVGALRLDNVIIPPASFSPIGTTGFFGAQLTITLGSHTINGTNLPFGIFVYGYDSYDSYGYPGGQSLAPVANVTNLSVTPLTGTGAVETAHCLQAVVRDQFNNPLAGVRVDFVVTGVNPGGTGFATTNASGIASYCYTGTNTGEDNIAASVGTLTVNAKYTWTPKGNVFYSKPWGALHLVASWGVNADGSGANPADFGVDKTFNLANRSGTYTLTGNWSVDGTLNNPAGSQLQINGHSLSLATLTGTGTLTGSNTSSLTIAGAAGGNFGNLSFTTNGGLLKTLTVNRTGSGGAVAIGTTPLSVFELLNVTSGAFNTNGRLTLKSTATNTARVAPVMGTITGNVTVERYIPARRAWRIVSAPVAGTQSVNQAFQEGATTASAVPNPAPGYGTHITVGTVANGFDQNVFPGESTHSIKIYNSAVDNWLAVTNTHTARAGTIPYMLFVRGDRGITMRGSNVPATNTTLRATGPLNVGNQTFTVNARGFTAIANPFASPINFQTITRNNVDNSFYVWDPKMGGTNGVGAYVNISFNGTGYDVIPASVSPESQYIQSGQGFLVHSLGGIAGSVVIKESDKSATPAANVFRKAENGEPLFAPAKGAQGLRVTLQLQRNAADAVLDEVFASYSDAFSNEVDQMDVVKMPNVAENLSIIRNEHQLMVDRRAVIKHTDTLHLKLWNTQVGDYLFEFNPTDLSGAESVLLEDRYLKTRTQVNLDNTSQVFFQINAEAGSGASDRFRVIINKTKPLSVLGKPAARVFPNPILGNEVGLRLENFESGTYELQLINSAGQVVYSKNVFLNAGTRDYRLALGSSLNAGVYQLNIQGKGTSTVIKILK